MYQKVPVTITVPQFKKLIAGRPAQLAAHQLQPTHRHHVMVHPLMAAKMHKARVAGKGVRLQMSPHEIEMTGEGWGDLWNSVKKAASWAYENVPKAYSWVKSNVIDTPFYQEKVKPFIRGKIIDKLESAPYANYSVPSANWIGEQTNAWGVHHKSLIPKPRAKAGRIVQQRQRRHSAGSFRV